MKANLIIPDHSIFQPDSCSCFVLIILLVGLIIYLYLSDKKSKKGRPTWFAGLALVGIVGWLHGEPGLLLQFVPGVLLAWLKSKRKDEQQVTESEKVVPNTAPDLVYLIQENALLKKRISELPETFITQAQYFESLLTLNEIQLVQGMVESAAQFLRANQVSLYQFSPSSGSFNCAARYHHTKGFVLEQHSPIEDRLLSLIRESRSELSIREILHNDMLYQIWQKSTSKALVYCPIVAQKQFIGILTIDEIRFVDLNRQTISNAKAAAKLAAQAFKNVRAHQNLLAEKNSIQSKLLTEYQQFLKTLNFEFKRACRGQLPLSLLLIVLEPGDNKTSIDKDGAQLTERIRQNCKKNLREVDFIFADDLPTRFWVILPMTDFNGLAYVMERLNLIIHMDIAGQSNYFCYFGFSSQDQEIKQPKQMIENCKESLQLHRTVRQLLSQKKLELVNS